jgi:hypothetical protein
MSINLAAIRNQLLPGLLDVTGEYEKVDAEWKSIFTTKTSKMALERSLQVRYLGPARQKTEGAASYADNDSGDRGVYTIEPVEASIMYAMTRKAIDDGLYRDQFRPTNLGLNNAMVAFWNALAANILNTATTYDPAIGGDGKALLAPDHPIDTGVLPNTASTPLALNETSLIQAAKNIRKNWRDEAGILIDAWAETLVIPVHLEDVAIRLQQSELRPGTANNDPNVIPKVAGGIKNYKVMRYLTSDYAWFLTTNIKGLLHIQRRPYETSMWVDEQTDNLMVKNYERAGFGFNDPRAIYGMLATA